MLQVLLPGRMDLATHKIMNQGREQTERVQKRKALHNIGGLQEEGGAGKTN